MCAAQAAARTPQNRLLRALPSPARRVAAAQTLPTQRRCRGARAGEPQGPRHSGRLRQGLSRVEPPLQPAPPPPTAQSRRRPLGRQEPGTPRAGRRPSPVSGRIDLTGTGCPDAVEPAAQPLQGPGPGGFPGAGRTGWLGEGCRELSWCSGGRAAGTAVGDRSASHLLASAAAVSGPHTALVSY